MDFKGKDFLKLLDFTPDEITALLDLAAELKAKKRPASRTSSATARAWRSSLKRPAPAPAAPSRWRLTTSACTPSTSTPTGSQIGKKESIADTARVLSRMFDGIEYRGFGQSIVEELAQYASVPVWNGLTNEFHPTQILADMLTIREHFGTLKGIKLVYMGDARYNMGNSLMIGCAKLGMHFVACAPLEFFPDEKLIDQAQEIAAETGAILEFWTEPETALKNADVVYTDIWVSMGEPPEAWAERIGAMLPYQVNAKAMSYAKPTAVFMHCLPAFHDLKTTIGKEVGEQYGLDALEVTDEVFEGPQSIVFDEAENRMHTIKAVMAATLAGLEI